MSVFSIFFIIIIVLLLISLLYTYSLARGQKAAEETRSRHDRAIPAYVQESPFLRNPVFLAYFVFSVLLILAIIYFAVT
ncbi:hypothetical protein J9303_15480 [Bacillaceae bacterium Marseille-Q3522]|nr:hypothetical protein [Bacillaceae bacterium Marseille-Q3522]